MAKWKLKFLQCARFWRESKLYVQTENANKMFLYGGLSYNTNVL